MKTYHNGPRKGMAYGGNVRKPMMYGGSAMKPRKKAQMGGMMSANPMMQQQPALSTNMAGGGKAFPDLTGDGKVTQKDILKGRGVKLMYGGKAKKRGY